MQIVFEILHLLSEGDFDRRSEHESETHVSIVPASGKGDVLADIIIRSKTF